MGKSVVVLMAESGGAASILETMLDWQAAGLLRDFVWVDSSQVKPGAVPALMANAGQLRGTSIQAALHGRVGHLVRIATIHPLYSGAPAPSMRSEQGLQDALSRAGVMDSSAVRIIVPRGSNDEPTEHLYHGGWRNVVVSPEESSGPVSGTVPLSEDVSDSELASHAASAIASLVGLWQDMEEAPFDESYALLNAVSLTRAHVRWLDASRAESVIRHRVLTVSGQVPQPLVRGQQGTFLPDPGAASQAMAREILGTHEGSFRSVMEGEVGSGPQKIGILQAFRLFLVFLTSSLLFQPQLWVKVFRMRVASGAANATQALFFGNDSQFLVVPTLDSGEMTARDLANVGRNLEQHLMSQGVISQRRPPTFPTFFREMLDGAFSLIDGGQRGRISGVKVGADVGVVASTDVVVSPRDSDFVVDSGLYSSCDGYDAIPSHDPRGMRAAHAAMNAQGTYGEGQSGGAAMAHALQSWASTQPRTYVSNITEGLNAFVEDAAARVKNFVQLLQEASQTDTSSDREARGTTSRALRWTAGIHVVLAVVAYFVWDWRGWGTLVLVGLAIALLFSWLISSFAVFMRGQRQQFEELYRREKLHDNHEVYRTNLIRSVSDLTNATAAYEQSQRWGSVLRSFVADPFGELQSGGSVSGVPKLEGLPLNVGLGELEVDDRLEARLGVHLRAVSFHAGWLTRPWEHVLASAAQTIGPEAFILEQQPEKMLDQQVGVDHSFLDRWVPLLARSGVSKDAGDSTWADVAARLTSPKFPVDWRHEVDVRLHSGVKVSQDDFLEGFQSRTVAAGGFDSRLRSSEASRSGFDASETPWMSEVEVGLGRRIVRVEESEGLTPFSLTIHRDAEKQTFDVTEWTIPSFEVTE